MTQIKITVTDGKFTELCKEYIDGDGFPITQAVHLKEIAIVNALLQKEQQQIMNKQKDDSNKLKFATSNTTTIKGVTSIIFKNGMEICISDDQRSLIAVDPKCGSGMEILLSRESSKSCD